MNKKLRFEIFKRDNFTCQYCGRQTPNVVLEVDHIIPRAEGGTDDPNNLITACFDCNRGKGKIKLSKSAIKDNRAEETQEMIELEEQIKEYEKAMRSKKAAETRRVNKINKAWLDYSDNKYELNDSGLSTIRNFLRSLTSSEIIEAIEIASKRIPITQIEQRFKYFCGICHNRIAQKNGDNSKLLYNKVKQIWKSQKRGSGYFTDYQMKEICATYDEQEILDAIQETFSQRRGNYWQYFKETLGGEH